MKRFGIIFVILLVSVGAMLNSCVESDVDFISESSPILRFGISSATVNTRAADAAQEDMVEQADSVCWSVMEVEGDEEFSEPLYVTMIREKREVPMGDDAVSNEAATRGAPVTTNTFATMYGSRGFGLFAYVYAGTWDAEETTSEYVHNLPVKYMSSYWALAEAGSSTQYYWPGSNYKVRFYAYAPYVGDYYDSILSVPATAYTGVPKIDVTVSSVNAATSGNNLTTHPDLVIAKSGEVAGDKNSKQSLTFHHAMAAVRFKVGAMFVAGTIKKVEFRNVLRSGTLNLESQAWDDDKSNLGNVSFTKDVAITGEVGQMVLSEDEYFMMLPQSLPSNAQLVITFVQSSNSQEHTITVELGDKDIVWEMGNLYTYTLTATQAVTDVYTFDVVAPSVTSADYLGNKSTNGTVKSYRVHTNRFGIVTKEATEWTTEYSTDGGSTWTTTRPEFFSAFTASGSGKVDATEEYSGTIAPITPDDPKNPFDVNVANRPVNSITTNLYTSNSNSTGNCYVINAAGTYTFPLIYGNAISGNKDNTNAYNGSTFVNHNGDPITSPFITDMVSGITSAQLLWCDAANLVTDVVLSSASETIDVIGKKVRYITFRVPKESLTAGNAVIALYKGSDTNAQIVWSWHIWVTPWKGEGVTVKSNSKDFTFATQILGYCPARNATWNKRDVKIRFKQSGSGKVSSVYSFEQEGKKIEYSEGNVPFYQWGRKDPLMPYNYITESDGTSTDGAEKICYSSVLSNETISVKYSSSTNYSYMGLFRFGDGKAVDIKIGIKNPHVFYPRYDSKPYYADYSEYDWASGNTVNRWDAKITANATDYTDVQTVKTVYDPCPPGWCVPPAGAWQYWTANAGSGYKAANADSSYPYKNDNTRAFVYANKFVMPVTGDRNRYNGIPWKSDTSDRPVEAWTSTPKVVKNSTGTKSFNGACYVVSSKTKYTISELARCSGFAVVPVKEH